VPEPPTLVVLPPEPPTMVVRSRTLAAALLIGVARASTPIALTLNAKPVADSLPAATWKDYFIVADDEDANLVFQVNATSNYANALGLYVSEELPVNDERTNPGSWLAMDAVSMITIDGIRQFQVVLAQCYVRKAQRYYVSLFGKNVAGGSKPMVPFTIQVTKVPARIPMNGTITGQVCDSNYMHYFWDAQNTFTSGGVRTTVAKLEGELDQAFMRYERCAGLSGQNLAQVGLQGHGSPSGTVILPEGAAALEAGRYYVSIKGKQELCGTYSINPQKISQVQLLASPAASTRASRWLGLLSLLPAWLLGRGISR